MPFLGKSPPPAALTASDITDGIVSNAKLAQDIISADTALGATPADTDEFLVSDAGTLKRMDYSHIKAANTPFFLANGSGSLTLANDTNTLVSILAESYDTDNTFASNRFTPAVAGYYYLEGQVSINNDSAGSSLVAMIYKNGSEISLAQVTAEGTNQTYTVMTSELDLADTDDYYELYAYQNSGSGKGMNAGYCWFKGFKLIT